MARKREAEDDGGTERRLKRFLCVVTVYDNDDRFICVFSWETQKIKSHLILVGFNEATP